MKRKSIFPFGVFGVGIMVVWTLGACTGGGSTAPQIPSIMSPTGMSNTDAAAKNNEGVDHLVQGHWDVAIKHLKKAIAAKSNFAAAHFNMAVALDGNGKHAAATASFKKAKEFGANNPKITESTILKEHLKEKPSMEKTSEETSKEETSKEETSKEETSKEETS